MKDLEQLDDESQKEYVERLRRLVAEERSRPRSDDPLGPLDFVANIIYSHENPTRISWALIKDDQRQEYRLKATQTVETWAKEQMLRGAVKPISTGRT